MRQWYVLNSRVVSNDMLLLLPNQCSDVKTAPAKALLMYWLPPVSLPFRHYISRSVPRTVGPSLWLVISGVALDSLWPVFGTCPRLWVCKTYVKFWGPDPSLKSFTQIYMVLLFDCVAWQARTDLSSVRVSKGQC
jgi:hypothetical protein